MNRQTEIENIIRTLWDIDDVTVNAESKYAINKAIQSLQDVRIALKNENDNFKATRGINNSRKPLLSGRDRNKESLDKVFNDRTAIKSSYVNCLGYDCLLVNPDFIDNHDLYFVDYEIDNDVVQYTIFHDDEDQYYAVKGEY